MRLLTAALLLISMIGSKVQAQSAVVFLPQAARWLDTQYHLYGEQEFVGCMIGGVTDDTVLVYRIASPDMKYERTRLASAGGVPAVRVLKSCAESGWDNTIGEVHSHPGGQNCTWFQGGYRDPALAFNGDLRSFLRDPTQYPVSAIFCGDHYVWVARNEPEQEHTAHVKFVSELVLMEQR